MTPEEIVRNLAADGAPLAASEYDGTPLCVCCAVAFFGDADELGRHEPTCPWRQAVEWVAAHPQVIGEPFDVPSEPGMAPMSGVIVEGPMPGRPS